MSLTKEEYEFIFDEISEGRSLRSALAQVGCGFSKFYDGLKNSKELTEQYASARANQAESSFQNILGSLAKVENGTLGYNEGRLIIDTYKWIAARLKPTVYADKPLLDIGDNSPTEITVRWASKPKELKEVSESTEPMELPE